MLKSARPLQAFVTSNIFSRTRYVIAIIWNQLRANTKAIGARDDEIGRCFLINPTCGDSVDLAQSRF